MSCSCLHEQEHEHDEQFSWGRSYEARVSRYHGNKMGSSKTRTSFRSKSLSSEVIKWYPDLSLALSSNPNLCVQSSARTSATRSSGLKADNSEAVTFSLRLCSQAGGDNERLDRVKEGGNSNSHMHGVPVDGEEI